MIAFPKWGVDLIGSAAAVCTTISFLPQLIKVWRLKSARDISLIMFLLFSTGVALWLSYGILIASWPVIVANGFTLIFAVAILILKLRYDRRPAKRDKGAE
jgi:MtN3 and saliva related transmembrane protein